jgi:PAS domain S-box-containing protein
MVSITGGYLKPVHVPLIDRMRYMARAAMAEDFRLDYLIVDAGRMKGGHRLARKKYMESLKDWHREYPMRGYIIYGANAFMRAAAFLAQPFMPFKVKIVRDINQAFQFIRDDRSPNAPNAHDPSVEPSSLPAPYGRHMNQLLAYIGSIDWANEGIDSGFDVDEEHPFYILFQSIKLIKGELDDLFAERRQAEAALNQSEEKYRELFEKGSDWIYIHDLDGNIIQSNLDHKDELGRRDGSSGIRANIKDLIPERYHDQCDDYFERISRNGHDQGLVQIIGKGGRKIILDYNAILIPDDAGASRLVKGTARNVTREIRAAKIRKKLEEQLVQSQKMQAIGTLAGGIAHDFNNILTPLVGYTEMMLDEVPKTNSLREPLEEIMVGTMRAKDLVKQILAFSRQGDKETKPLKVQHILEEVLRLVRPTLPATIDIKKSISPDCGMVMADPAQVHQIVMNLITNAFHAMEDGGGVLTIGLKEMVISADTLPDQTLIPGKYICLTVVDTGMGMDARNMEKIFEPYFTTKKKTKGTGLGLAVVHGIVQSYGGAVAVSSKIGEGTTFNVFFPRIITQASGHIETKFLDIQAGHESILLVDDETAILKMLGRLLSNLGYKVTTLSSSVMALKTFAAAPDDYDLVITDMTMPGVTGDQLALELKKIRASIPVILCTGFSEKIQENRDHLRGVSKVLMKPICREELASTVRCVMDHPEIHAASREMNTGGVI